MPNKVTTISLARVLATSKRFLGRSNKIVLSFSLLYSLHFILALTNMETRITKSSSFFDSTRFLEDGGTKVNE